MNINVFYVVPYFGVFPNYIQLWLDSCGRNEKFSWLLLTDCSVVNLNIPQNVIVKESTLEIFKNILGKKLGSNICLNSPYKLCDFRPVYWMILDFYKINYDFWGYCDMDLIFGRLSHFLPDEMFDKYDRIYSEGHLSLMSSSPFSKYAFMFDGSKLKWDNVFFKNNNIGFDEHYGVNKIWKKQKFLYYEKASDVLDIDPQFTEFNLTHLPSNKQKQFFYIEEGKVLQGFINKKNTFSVKEYAYIHFQKRKLPVIGGFLNCKRFMIGHEGFECLNTNPENYFENLVIFKKKSYNFCTVKKKYEDLSGSKKNKF